MPSRRIIRRDESAPSNAPSDPGTFRNGSISASSYSDMAQSYDPINSYSQGSAGGSYTVRTGDTLQSIAQAG